MHSSSILISCCLLSASLFAQQQTKVVPSELTSLYGTGAQCADAFHSGRTRVQQTFLGKTLCKTRAKITGISFRANMNARADQSRTIKDLRVTLGHSKYSPATMSNVFAENYDEAGTVVFQGSFDLPRLTNASPTNWQIRINFQKPFYYERSAGPLLVDIDNRDTYALVKYSLDGVGVGRNRIRGLFPGKCGIILPQQQCIYFRAAQKPNGNVDLAVSNVPEVWPAMVMVGASATRWGTIPLPLDMTAFGASRGNELQVSPDIVLPVTLSKSRFPGYEGRFEVPKDFAQQWHFYAQAIVFGGQASLPIAMSTGWEVKAGLGDKYMQTVIGWKGASSGVFFSGSSNRHDPKAWGGPIVRFTGTFE